MKRVITCIISITLGLFDIGVGQIFEYRSAFVVAPCHYGGTRFFMMLPGKNGEMPRGVCYEVDDKGHLMPVWNVHGWYSRPGDLLLTDDGVGLVRIVPIFKRVLAKMETPLEEEICLEFYRNGELVKKIPLRDVLDTSKDMQIINKEYIIDNMQCRAEWPKLVTSVNEDVPAHEIPRITKHLKRDDVIFVLNTTQNDRLFFNVSTGELIYRLKHGEKSDEMHPRADQ